MTRKIIYWIPVLCWCFLIFYLSGIPNLKTEFGFWDFILRKCAHMAEYAILFLLSRRAFGESLTAHRARTQTIAAFLFTVLYAASDEFHQSFVPTRGPSVVDVGIDTVGAGLGLALLYARRAPRAFRRLMV